MSRAICLLFGLLWLLCVYAVEILVCPGATCQQDQHFYTWIFPVKLFLRAKRPKKIENKARKGRTYFKNNNNITKTQFRYWRSVMYLPTYLPKLKRGRLCSEVKLANNGNHGPLLSGRNGISAHTDVLIKQISAEFTCFLSFLNLALIYCLVFRSLFVLFKRKEKVYFWIESKVAFTERPLTACLLKTAYRLSKLLFVLPFHSTDPNGSTGRSSSPGW